MFARSNAVHSQVAYVTNDMDRALATFRDAFGVPAFHVFTNDAPGLQQYPPLPVRIALAKVGGVEIELIQPLDETPSIFSEPLPADGAFAVRFHHVACRIGGSIDDYRAHMASLDPALHKVVVHGGLGDVMRFAYTDERATLGHFVEHVWMDPDLLTQLMSVVPTYPAAAA